MLPKRHGGIGEGYSKIIVIDAGNCSDVYQIVNFARQYGLEVRKVLRNMLVSRVFTIYQLAHFIIHELPRVIERLSSDSQCRLIVVYGLLHLFVSDPHIDKADAKQLIKEIAASIGKISEDRFVVVSTNHCKSEYESTLYPIFDDVFRITNDTEDSKVLRINVHNQDNRIAGRRFCTSKSIKVCERELIFVPSR